jgi:flagellin-like protein
MNVFGRASQKWRKNRNRGVSPIIATILLVAITVVLAAVLYVLISGLTGSTASAPIALAPAVTGTGGGGATWYVAVGVAPSSTIATTQFGLKVTNTTATQVISGAVGGAGCTLHSAYTGGTTCTGVAGKWYAVLTNATGNIVAIYLSSGWGTSVSISGGSFTVNVISAAQYDGQGYSLTAYGTGSASVSGTVQL